jgi:hypothetical protein
LINARPVSAGGKRAVCEVAEVLQRERVLDKMADA